jgi:acyl-CoA dehydrogenase
MDFRLPPDLVEWQQNVRDFVVRELQPHDEEIERTGVIPPGLVQKMAERGLFGANTPRAYGGLGLSMLGGCLATAELAKAHVALYYRSGINAHIGSKAIELDGSEAQKRRWLPELASGRTIAALALTEPEAGSDAASIRMAARRDGDAYVLDGRKIYITNAAEAGLFTVFATVDPAAGARGITAFLVEAGTPGLTVERLIEMAGGRGASHGEVVFRECRVSAANRIGAEGQGFASAMRCLDTGRLHWGAYCVGVAERLLGLATLRASERRQFGRPLREHQQIEFAIADMAASLHAARLVAYEAAWRYDQEPKDRQLSGALSKLIGADMVDRVADQTLQIFGGAGYSKDYPIERIWREVRVVRILDGTSEMMRRIVARYVFRPAGPGPDDGRKPIRP